MSKKRKNKKMKSSKVFVPAIVSTSINVPIDKLNYIKSANHVFRIRRKNTLYPMSNYQVWLGKEIFPGQIYIGNLSSTFTKSVGRNKFTHIIHCCETNETQLKPKLVEEMKIEELHFGEKGFLDESTTNLFVPERIPKVIEFLDKAFENNKRSKVLIHCYSGMSRSVTACVAYMMYRRRIKYRDALDLVKFSRSNAMPHGNFPSQLLLLQKNDFKITPKLVEVCQAMIEKDPIPNTLHFEEYMDLVTGAKEKKKDARSKEEDGLDLSMDVGFGSQKKNSKKKTGKKRGKKRKRGRGKGRGRKRRN